jgi:hypothetical protein
VRYKPYILARVTKGEMDETVTELEKLLTENGFEIVGNYSPMQDQNRIVICVTNEDLKKSVDKVIDKLEIIAFASVMRFALIKENDKITITYRNPLYWGNAFFRNDFPKVEAHYNTLNSKIAEMFKGLPGVRNRSYGSEKGEKIKSLRKYRFGWFFPYFDDVIELAEKTNYETVTKTIEENLSKSVADTKKVYSISFPGKQLMLYGIATYCKDCEPFYFSLYDKKAPNHDPSLPWEILVMEKKVVMLHGKFLLALAYPDFGMFTFMKAKRIGKHIPGSFKKVIGVEEK